MTIPNPSMNPNAEKDFSDAIEAEKAYLDGLGIKSVADNCKAEAEKLKEVIGDSKFTLMPFAEEKHINKVVIQYSYSGEWQDFVAILLHNDYSITITPYKALGEIEITWGDKA